ncbi:MAG: hypothetical protein JWP11_1937 [Frankiales bacterium]|nr:hypothetical protein [Frankiales bacterium]
MTRFERRRKRLGLVVIIAVIAVIAALTAAGALSTGTSTGAAVSTR